MPDEGESSEPEPLPDLYRGGWATGPLVLLPVFVILGAAIAIVVLGLRYIPWTDAWRFVVGSPLATQVIVTGAFVGLGFGFFWLRENLPRLYGLGEVAVGTAVVFTAWSFPSSSRR